MGVSVNGRGSASSVSESLPTPNDYTRNSSGNYALFLAEVSVWLRVCRGTGCLNIDRYRLLMMPACMHSLSQVRQDYAEAEKRSVE